LGQILLTGLRGTARRTRLRADVQLSRELLKGFKREGVRRDKRIGLVLSGSNITVEQLCRILNGEQAWVLTQFSAWGGQERILWIGLHDADPGRFW
jgi:hypothetical protein